MSRAEGIYLLLPDGTFSRPPNSTLLMIGASYDKTTGQMLSVAVSAPGASSALSIVSRSAIYALVLITETYHAAA